MSSRLTFGALVALILTAIPVGWWLFLREPPAGPPVVPPPVVTVPDAGPKAIEIHLGEVNGSVQIRRGLDGGWADAQPGDVLNPSDGVRTANGAMRPRQCAISAAVKMRPINLSP